MSLWQRLKSFTYEKMKKSCLIFLVKLTYSRLVFVQNHQFVSLTLRDFFLKRFFIRLKNRCPGWAQVSPTQCIINRSKRSCNTNTVDVGKGGFKVLDLNPCNPWQGDWIK